MSGADAGAFLRSCAVFASVPASEIRDLAARAQEDRYRAREYVFMEGDPALWFCVVRSGHVKILRHARSGRDIVLELLGPGEPFGGVAVIEKRPYPASAQATEPSVVIKLPQEPIVALAERHPSIIKAIALMIGQRLRAAHESVTSLAVDPVETRLAAALLRLAEREGAPTSRGVMLPFPLTRHSLADMTGTTVETTIRVLSRWTREGLLEEDASGMVLRDVAALRAMTEGEGN